MARYRRRRFTSARPVSRRQLEVVRAEGAATFTSSNNAAIVDLLLAAEGQAIYQKDLTPSTVAGVKGHFTYFSGGGSGSSTTGFDVTQLGVGLIHGSRRQMAKMNAGGEDYQEVLSPLDPEGRYQRWHYRQIRFPIIPASAQGSDSAVRQASDNRTGIRVKSRRKLHTVDDSYFLIMDTVGLDASISATLQLRYEVSIFLQKP